MYEQDPLILRMRAVRTSNFYGSIIQDALREIERLRGIVPEVLERLNDELCAENEAMRAKLGRALTVCRCAARVVDSSAYQGVSDEDCDLENAVNNWRALGASV